MKIKTISKYQFNENEILGQGSLGKVYKANLVEEVNGEKKVVKQNQLFAIKMLQLNVFKQYNISDPLERIMQEIELQKDLDHPHITKYVDAVKTEQNVYIVTEFCNGGNLEQYIYNNRPKEQRVLFLFSQIISGFKYLMTEKNIIHRDIKPSNILIHDDIPKICDFSISRKSNILNDTYKTITGTPLFSSPQILKGKEYTSKSEVWSLGVTLYFMLFFKLKDESIQEYDSHNICNTSYPWFANTNKLLKIAIKEQQKVRFPEDVEVSEQVKQLIARMLVYDEKNRISTDELFNHELFVKYDQNLKQAKINNMLTDSFHQFNESQLPECELVNKVQENIDSQVGIIEFMIQILDYQKALKDYCEEFYGHKKLLPSLLQSVLCVKIQKRLENFKSYLAGKEEVSKRGVFLYKQKNSLEFNSINKKVDYMIDVYEKNVQNIQKCLKTLEKSHSKFSESSPNQSLNDMIQNTMYQSQFIQDNIKQLFLGMKEIHFHLLQQATLNKQQLFYLEYLDDLISFHTIDQTADSSSYRIKSSNIQKLLQNSLSKQIASPQSFYSRIVVGFSNLFSQN
ncbi:Serine/Threonine kinase domain protein (macronuclear) [Tetrahymena thermophila SB210]|uniref:Serine/Threonine kinase domain protein n=1 Tax=Tetrahymena thermophila (strain SB210) TaxID=312017 RepID=Q22GG0_TETTS|nr:Serine/Threonine kinase domain protein [Tetrahymena thermophila SB210]EAR84371.1 Serine/Threonine kinase domain protein [Tetrahymena thermophila SB210]|eukprot:XP_001032034.1 Serine/Threonine kinase domain protein [Tetrahymena thermophila SB210]